MADDKRKKKRGRKTKLNLRSCFQSFANETNSNKSNDRHDLSQTMILSSRCNDDPHRSSHRRSLSRLLKAKKKIDRTTSKSSVTSDTSESASSLTSEKSMKSLNNNTAIRVRESTDLDSSLVSSCSRTTSSSNLSLSCCSSSNSNSQWSSEQKTTSSRIELVDFKPNPNPNQISSTSRSDSLPKPNKPISSKTLVSSNSLPLPKPNNNPNQNKIKSIGTNLNNVLWCLFLLLSLVVLVVYGRIYSILCTSTWFYFVPCRKMKRVNSASNVSVKVVDTDSEQYKKRVIMAGLLDRTRNPLR